jgi:ribosome maturation protein Sdo1
MASKTDYITMILTGIKAQRRERERERERDIKTHIYKKVLKPTYSEQSWMHTSIQSAIEDPNVNQQLIAAHDSCNFIFTINNTCIHLAINMAFMHLKQEMSNEKKKICLSNLG